MSKLRNFTDDRAPEDFHVLFTDFNTYAASDWVITTTEAGAGAATEALSNARGGVLVVTNDDADDDKDCFQWAGGSGAVVENFKYTAGKAMQFVARLKTSDADNCDLKAGLYITNTTPIAGVSDGIYFRVTDGDASLYLEVIKDSVASAVDTGVDLADDTYVKLEWYYNGSQDAIIAVVDDVPVCSAPLTNVPDDEELALSFAFQNGAAAAKVLSVDYIGARQER